MEEEKVEVTLLFFAKARELVGKSCDSLFLDRIKTLDELIVSLVSHYPQLDCLCKNFIIAQNQTYISNGRDTITLNANDEIAIIPPISGG